MILDVADLAAWSPESLDALADELDRNGRLVERVAETVGSTAEFDDRWDGRARRLATRVLLQHADDCAALARSYRGSAEVTAYVASCLRDLHSDLAAVAAWASDRGLVADDSALSELAPQSGSPVSATDADVLRTRLRQLVDRADALDREASDLLRRELDDGRAATDPALRVAGSVIERPMPPLLPAGASPTQVARWWNDLDDVTRTAVVTAHPEHIGLLDGVPAAARDLANRVMLEAERQRLEAVAARLQAELDGMWLADTFLGRAGVTGWFTDADAGLEQTRNKIAALDAIDATLARGDRQLLALDLSGREAMAAVAVGDLDTADRVAVFVPGAGSTVQGNLAGYDEQVAALREDAAQRADGNDTVSSVTWLNYQAPQWGWGLAFTERSPVSDLAARIAAPRLTEFLDGIVESRSVDPSAPAPVVTAVGHSYGAVVTGLALQHTDSADAAVFLGAPGIGTDDVGALRIPEGSAYLVEADCDPVADAGTFGGDPSFLDGLVRLPSGPAIAPDGALLDETIGHSAYLRPGTSSAHEVSGVVAGIEERSLL